MSDPNWASPSGPGFQPPGGPPPGGPPAEDQPQPVAYAVPGQQQNWGLAVPGMSYAILVPRPPRPGTVGVATALAYAGVAIGLAYEVLNSIYSWRNRNQLFGDVTSQPGIDQRQLVDASTTFGLVFSGVLSLLVAAGVVVCAILTTRKKNPARITLAVLLGVLGLYNLCSVGGAGAFMALDQSLEERGTSSSSLTIMAASQITWWTIAAQALLAVTALIGFVLLVVPPTNRYFVAGAGRRFAPEV
jgi:hypothetical protein